MGLGLNTPITAIPRAQTNRMETVEEQVRVSHLEQLRLHISTHVQIKSVSTSEVIQSRDTQFAKSRHKTAELDERSNTFENAHMGEANFLLVALINLEAGHGGSYRNTYFDVL